MAQRDKKIIVIGAGLGGMSAAIALAAAGYSVEVFEKNAKVGGKLNLLQANGFTFDLGPSILTLPQAFDELFARAGKKFEEMVPIRPLDPQWRNFFEDGTTFDLFYDRDQMRAELRRFDPASEEGFFKFLHYSEQQYAVVERGYFQHGLDTVNMRLWNEAIFSTA
jgi:diapolycopene oxygenase